MNQNHSTPKNRPSISIITAVLNDAKGLEKTIQSVMEQSYTPIQHIVIDGGSTDGTLQVIEHYKEHLGYWVSEPDSGPLEALNKGIDQAQGELINILQAGTYFAPGILNRVGESYRNHGFFMALCDYFWIYPKYPNKQFRDQKIRVSQDPQIMKKGLAVCVEAVFYQRRLHEEFGKFDPAYLLANDYHFLRKVYDQYGAIQIKEVACYYPLGGLSDLGFMGYANEMRKICHHLNDPFWQVEWTYWFKYFKFMMRKMLQFMQLDSLLFFYRHFKHQQKN